MHLWPQQLATINELSTRKGFSTVELIALPLRVRCTVSYLDGTWQTVDINHDGKQVIIHDSY